MAYVRNNKKYLAFLKRRHPVYMEMLMHWNFLEATYRGGRRWFEEHIFKYLKEGEQEFQDRKSRAYRFNHTRETVDLVQKYIFKADIARKTEDVPKTVESFWKNATLSGLDINQFMKLVSTGSSVFGRIWVFVDTTKTEDIVSRADEKAAGARTYAYFVKPQNVLDMGFDDTGDLLWILVYETRRDDADPIEGSGEIVDQYRLWTRSDWKLFEIEESSDSKKDDRVKIVASGEHNLGRVPCFPVDHVIGENRYSAPAMIADIAYLDRACANYLSNLDAIIQDQTFSQLAMPAQGVLPGEETYSTLLDLGTKRVFIYDGGEGNARPEFISPDPKQAEIILKVINKIIGEIYHSIGMAGERTKEDNAVGIDNSSGVAKAYDFERVNSLLSSKADSLERAEMELIDLVLAWSGEKSTEEVYVTYPDDFDIRGLYDEFTIGQNLMLMDAPDTVRREQMSQIIDKLFPKLAEDLLRKMKDELKTWPDDPEDRATDLTGGKDKSSAKSPAHKSAKTDSRQGEVTSET